jgi:hypothetical protein
MKTKGKVVTILTSICAIGDHGISWDYIEIDLSSNDKEHNIGKFEKLKHKDGSINYGKDYAETKHDKFFNSPQRLNLVALNECEKTTIPSFSFKMCHGTLVQSSFLFVWRFISDCIILCGIHCSKM